METWFTADTHFGHTNIIKFCNRPFKSIDQMNRVLTMNWNARIKPEDFVLHLGDFAFKEKSKVNVYLKNLNGHITFLRGNHDNNNSLNTRIFSTVVKIGGKSFFCIHNPREVNLKYNYALVGHVHGKWRIKERGRCLLVNVGVDVWNFHPININEILKAISQFREGKT